MAGFRTHFARCGFIIATSFFALATPASAAWRETNEHIKSRGEVTVHALVAQRLNAETNQPVEPTDIAVFFPGAEGKVRPARDGVSRHGPRPSTMGLLAEKVGMAIAIGLPTDQSDGLSTAWRLGAEHVGDAGAVIDWAAKRYPNARFTLIGMSNGGRSVTRVASAMVRRGSPALRGVVVMASMPEAINEDVMKPIREAKVPVLVLHHKRDSCLPYRFMEEAAKPYLFIGTDDAKMPTVSPLNRECGPGSAHVFAGREEWAYGTIAEWVLTGAVNAAR